MGRLLCAALTVKHFGRSGRGGLFGGEGRRQQYWRTLDIFFYFPDPASTRCDDGEPLRAIQAGRRVQMVKGGGISIGRPWVFFYALDPASTCCAR